MPAVFRHPYLVMIPSAVLKELVFCFCVNGQLESYCKEYKARKMTLTDRVSCIF